LMTARSTGLSRFLIAGAGLLDLHPHRFICQRYPADDAAHAGDGGGPRLT
jgi:hypothetical protein